MLRLLFLSLKCFAFFTLLIVASLFIVLIRFQSSIWISTKNCMKNYYLRRRYYPEVWRVFIGPTEILSRSVTRFHWPGASLSIKNYHRQRYYPEVWRVFIGPTEILSWRVFIARRVTVTWICRYDRRWTSSGDTFFIVHNNIMCVRISRWCFDFCFLLRFFSSCVITASPCILRGSSRTIWLEKKSLRTRILTTTSQPFN